MHLCRLSLGWVWVGESHQRHLSYHPGACLCKQSMNACVRARVWCVFHSLMFGSLAVCIQGCM